MAFLIDSLYEEEVKGEMRTVLRLHPKLAPVKAAIFPLVNRMECRKLPALLKAICENT